GLRGVCGAVVLGKGARLIDHEGHHTRRAIVGRVREEGKATRHLSVDYVVRRATRSVGALAGQHLVVVAVERCRTPAGVMLISFGRRIGYQWADRAFRLAFLDGPVQTVLFACRAEDGLCVLRYPR